MHRLVLLLLAAMEVPAAALTLGAPFADHMVLQRDQPIPIWGTAARGEAVTVRLGNSMVTTRAGEDGQWLAILPARPADAAPTTVSAHGEGGLARSIDNVLIGDLFLCSGQSNMAMRVGEALNGNSISSAANDPLIRLATVQEAASPAPQTAFPSELTWGSAEPGRVRATSATCYAMLRALRQTSSMPMGAIVAAWGGTRLSTWLSPVGAAKTKDQGADLLSLYTRDESAAAAAFSPTWESWWRGVSGDAKGAEPWNAPDHIAWTPVPAIQNWEQWGVPTLANHNGLVWFRYSVTLDRQDLGRDARLKLAVLDDMDNIWVNGTAVGNSFGWSVNRDYRVPRAVLKPGRNEIIVAIHDSWGQGGMHGPADKLQLVTGARTIPLASGWHYYDPQVTDSPPRAPWDSHAGTGMAWNAMLAPIGPTKFAAMAWYQGESDVGVPGYGSRLAALIAGTRAQAGQPALPFLIVQLPGFGAPPIAPGASGWADLREDQRRFAGADKWSALAVTIDLGERTDIHPANKTLVGERLARAFRALAAGNRSAASGPAPVSATREGDMIRVQLGGVTGELRHWSAPVAISLELCAAPDHCRQVLGRIENDSILIPTDGQTVTRIRHAWADAPLVNIFDDAPLPLVPFELPID